jgi:hypothetical protein
MFELLVGVLVGFGCGYGVREIISRRRYAAARDLALSRARSRQAHIDRLKADAKASRLTWKQGGSIRRLNLH